MFKFHKFLIHDKDEATLKGKGKGKVHPRTGHEGPDRERSIGLLFL